MKEGIHMNNNSLASNLCGTYQNKTAKCNITIDANHNIPAEVNMAGKIFISDAPIFTTEQNDLFCVIMTFPEKLTSQAVTLIKILAASSDKTNHLSRKIEVTIKAKIGLDFILGTLTQWFIIPDNSCNSTLMFILDKESLFPIF
jgi:hypothetical protein